MHFRRRSALFLGSLLSLLSPALHAAVEPVSAIAALRLYPHTGEAIRHLSVPEATGLPDLVVDNLPGNLDASGFQVRLLEGEGVRLGAIRYERLDRSEREPLPARLEVEAALRALGQEMEDLGSEVTALAKEAAMLKELRAAYLEGLGAQPASGLGDQVRDLFHKEQALLAQKAELERGQADTLSRLQREKAALETTLQEWLRREQALSGQVRIRLLGDPKGPLKVELRSRLADVGWEPVYRILAEPGEGQIELVYEARLRNGTAEAWDAVPITLLTGQPSWRSEAPEPRTVFLSRPRPQPEPVARFQADKAVMAMESMSMAAAPEPEVQQLTTQVELKLPEPANVEPFSRDQVVTLSRDVLEATFWSAVTPALDETAYLHGEATLDLDWPLLPGAATLLVDGAISATTRLPFVAQMDTFELGFGENPALEVEYLVMDLKDRDAGVFDKVRKYRRHYQTRITQHMTVPHEVRIRESFPIARDEAIEVERLEPLEASVDASNGHFERKAVLAPDEEAIFATRFEVTAPRDWELPSVF